MTISKSEELPLHSCAIFATHNSLLESKQFFGNLTLEYLDKQIEFTKYFPVCVEIDFEVTFTNSYLEYECELGKCETKNSIPCEFQELECRMS